MLNSLYLNRKAKTKTDAIKRFSKRVGGGEIPTKTDRNLITSELKAPKVNFLVGLSVFATSVHRS